MNPLVALFEWKVRGIRVVEIAGVILLAAMVFSTYVAKAGAASQSARVTELETRIASEHQRVRLLRTEVARLEQPARLEALSRAMGLAPVALTRRTTIADLPEIAPPQVVVSAPAPPEAAVATVEPASESGEAPR